MLCTIEPEVLIQEMYSITLLYNTLDFCFEFTFILFALNGNSGHTVTLVVDQNACTLFHVYVFCLMHLWCCVQTFYVADAPSDNAVK